MKSNIIYILILLLTSVLGAQGQDTKDSLDRIPIVAPDNLLRIDTTNVDTVVIKSSGKFRPDPKRATRLSLIIPGSGQVYNRDYWKVPFVYAGFGACIYAMQWNWVRYNDYIDAYKKFYDLETGKQIPGVTRVDLYVRGTGETYEATIDQVRRGRTFYRRWRDYGFVFFGLVYALSTIEANVAAHMKTFDISEDLSIKFEPTITHPLNPAGAAPGMRIVLGFR